MSDIRYPMGWLLVILPLHGIEQFFFGVDELYELQGQVGAVLGLLHAHQRAMASAGVRFLRDLRLIESHHVIKTMLHLDYFPGAVTAVPFVIVGVLLLRAVAREWMSSRSSLPSR